MVDATINPDQMEMYADPLSRGGVLEPDGTIEIKYRRPDLVRTMKRLDPTVRQLCADLASLAAALVTATSRPSSTNSTGTTPYSSFPLSKCIVIFRGDDVDTGRRCTASMGAVSPGPSPSQPLPVPPPSPGSIEELTRQEAIAELQRDQALLQKRLDERVAQLLPVYTQVRPRSRH